MTLPFWKRKTLEEMSTEEWESLCDRCGLCCLHKVQYEDSPKVHFTCVSCKLLNTHTATCSDYENRFKYVDDCIKVTPHVARTCTWLPTTCAYRRLAEGRDLPPWHHLITGSMESVHEADNSVRGYAICETAIDPEDLDDYIADYLARTDHDPDI